MTSRCRRRFDPASIARIAYGEVAAGRWPALVAPDESLETAARRAARSIYWAGQLVADPFRTRERVIAEFSLCRQAPITAPVALALREMFEAALVDHALGLEDAA